MIAGKEVSTMVSTHDLSITEGKVSLKAYYDNYTVIVISV